MVFTIKLEWSRVLVHSSCSRKLSRGRGRQRERLKSIITRVLDALSVITSSTCYESPVASTRIVTHARSSAAWVIAHSRGTAAGVVAHSRSTATGIAAHSWGAATWVRHLKGSGTSCVSVSSEVSRSGTGKRVHTFCGASNARVDV